MWKKIIFVVLVLAVLSGFSADAGDLSGDLSLVGTFGGSFYDIKVQGNYAYVAMTDGIQIFDVSISSSPKLVASYKTPATATAIFVVDNTVYAGVYENGILILDVSDPTKPFLLSSYDTSSVLANGYSLNGFFVSGNNIYIYGGGEEIGMQIIDVSDKTSPVLSGNFPSRGANYFVNGTTAFINSFEKLDIVDVSDTSSPSLLGSYSSEGLNINDVYVSGTTAYLVDGNEGLIILDVSLPSSPTMVGKVAVGGWAKNIHLSGATAFVDGVDGLKLTLIDVSIPSSPSIISTYDDGSFGRMDSSANILYGIASPGFQIIDVSETSNPALLGSSQNIGSVEDIVVFGTTAYIANGALGIFDVSDPSSPAFLGQFHTGGFLRDVFIKGSTAYIADYNKGLVIVDVSNPTSPTLLGSYAIKRASRVTVSGNIAYVGRLRGKIKIIDVSNPASPELLGKSKKIREPADMFVSGKTLFVRNAVSESVFIIDVSDASSPFLIKKIDAGYNSIFISGNNAYFASASFSIKDISNPALPKSFPNYLPGYGGEYETGPIYVSGNKAYTYVMGWENYSKTTGIAVIDVSNRSKPKVLDIYETKGPFYSIVASDNFVYIAGGSKGLTILEDSSVVADIVPPVVSSINKKKAGYGDEIVVKGSDFGDSSGKVYFGKNQLEGEVVTWENSKIKVTVPWGLGAGNAKGFKTKVYVEDANGVWSETWNKFRFIKPHNPKLKKISLKEIKTGDEITLTGNHFGPQKYGVATKGATLTITSWNNKSITITIDSVDAKKVKIRVGTKYSSSNWEKVTGIIDSK